jgi:hypothetical protein
VGQTASLKSHPLKQSGIVNGICSFGVLGLVSETSAANSSADFFSQLSNIGQTDGSILHSLLAGFSCLSFDTLTEVTLWDHWTLFKSMNSGLTVKAARLS